jgi:signal transduction histidine kinase
MTTLFRKRKSIREATLIYWLVFIYTIAALVWWFISLENQNAEIRNLENKLLETRIAGGEQTAAYRFAALQIQKEQKRRTTRNISEGLTFLGVIMIGAVFVYKAVKKRLRLNRQQQNFIMAVTHELKTPVAIAKLNIETLLKRKLEIPQQEKLLRNTLMEMHRLNDLATNILVVSQMESGDYKMQFEQVQCSLLVNNLLQDLRIQHPNREIHSSVKEQVFYTGDPLMLKLVFSNLIDNAIKYSPKNTPVNVQLTENQFSVSDSGTGIEQADKKNVFEKFFRAGNEFTRTAKGTGLGLYLCKKILTDHRATITINDNKPTGSIFTINF